jgi:hypothetical protein
MANTRQLFQTDGRWYKGNLHMHTTLSDGKLPPDKAIALYREAGYDFLALTDHWKQSEAGAAGEMLLLPGCEFDTGNMVDFPVFHIIGAGMEKPVALRRDPSRPPQQIIDAIEEAGGMAFLAHPAWSVTNPDDVLSLKGLWGAEIYNTVSGLPWNCRPDSSLYFDLWASRGRRIPCTAADDSHYYKGEQTRSYIMVNAPALTLPALREAIRTENFYASQGPRFESVEIGEGTVRVRCPQVETMIFYSNTVWCDDRVVTGGTRGADYRIQPTDRYVRVELIDAEGRRAWTSPFAVGNENEK